MRLSPLIALACSLLMLAGCATSTVSPAATTHATGSASCPNAPDPGTPAGWGPPATPPGVLPYLINGAQEMTCGPNRLLFVFLDPKTNAPIADSKRTAKVAFYDLVRDATKPTSTVDTSF